MAELQGGVSFCLDKVIAQYPAMVVDNNLVFCPIHQLAYQKDMTKSVEYDKDYFEKYINYEGTDIAKGINHARTDVTEKYCKTLVDIGIGSGEFIKSSKLKVYGYDINQYGISWLKERELYVDPHDKIPNDVDGFTFWDTLEHMVRPSDFLDLIPVGCFAFVSIPLFEKFHSESEVLGALKNNKHYRPNEHYYYFNRKSFCMFMTDCGFELIEDNEKEIDAGREGIYTFIFKKVKPGIQPDHKDWIESVMEYHNFSSEKELRELIYP